MTGDDVAVGADDGCESGRGGTGPGGAADPHVQGEDNGEWVRV